MSALVACVVWAVLVEPLGRVSSTQPLPKIILSQEITHHVGNHRVAPKSDCAVCVWPTRPYELVSQAEDDAELRFPTVLRKGWHCLFTQSASGDATGLGSGEANAKALGSTC